MGVCSQCLGADKSGVIKGFGFWKVFILIICSVSSEGFYHICLLINLAFGKWQYFIFSLPLSLFKLMVLGPCNLCSKWSSDFDFNRRFGYKILYT